MPPPTTKPKGLNPAPNYTASMNSIQLALAAKSKTPNLPPRRPRAAAVALHERALAEKNEVPRNAGLDDNMGIGAETTTPSESRERENRALRGRILGGARRKDGGGGVRKRRGEESSSDEEEGRSGLGRAKRKRKCREEGVDEEKVDMAVHGGDGDENGDGVGMRGVLTQDATEQAKAMKVDVPKDDEDDKTAAEESEQKDQVPMVKDEWNGIEDNPVQETKSKKKRKKNKKKKKNASEGPGDKPDE